MRTWRKDELLPLLYGMVIDPDLLNPQLTAPPLKLKLPLALKL